jgi:hypothetical protein
MRQLRGARPRRGSEPRSRDRLGSAQPLQNHGGWHTLFEQSAARFERVLETALLGWRSENDLAVLLDGPVIIGFDHMQGMHIRALARFELATMDHRLSSEYRAFRTATTSAKRSRRLLALAL